MNYASCEESAVGEIKSKRKEHIKAQETVERATECRRIQSQPNDISGGSCIKGLQGLVLRSVLLGAGGKSNR